jgi:hydrogenase 3 maturation protease
MGFAESLGDALEGAGKVVVVGIGNELNGDDGFGVRAAEELEGFHSVVSIQAHTVPENFVSKIAALKPSHVIFVDAAALDSEPGTLQLLSPGDLARVKTVTHRMPLSKLIERLMGLHDCRVLIVGFQPQDMGVGKGLSDRAGKALRELVGLLRQNL